MNINIMNKFIPVLLATLLLNFSLSGCSVKEDRDSCPCLLVLNMEGIEKREGEELLISISSENGFLYKDTLLLSRLPDKYSLEVPRGNLLLACFSPLGSVSDETGQKFHGNLISIKEGEDCPEIRMCCRLINTYSDTVHDTLRLYKNYCRLRLSFKGEEGATPSFNFKVEGKVSGYNAFGEPVEGGFSARMKAEGKGRFSLNLPRQKDNSLSLSLMDGLEVVRVMALGAYIQASGYDWASPDLEDIEMELDLARTLLTLKIDNWTQEIPFEILI